MTTIKILLAAILLFGSALAESDGNFTIQANIEDNYLYESGQTNNYGSADTLRAWQNNRGVSSRILLRATDLTDSMDQRTVADSAYLYLVVKSEGVTSVELVGHSVAQMWVETASDWLEYNTGGEGSPWSSSGCAGAGTDFYDYEVDSSDISSVSAGDTIAIDISASLDSGHTDEGWIIYLASAFNEDIIFYSSEDGTYKPYIYVTYNDAPDTTIEPSQCSNTQLSIGSGGAFYSVTKGTMLAFDCVLDSLNVRMHGIAADSLIPLCYKNWEADSALLDTGEAVYVDIADACTDVMLQFSGSAVLLADSLYFFGCQQRPNVADAYKFCCAGNGPDSSYYGANNYPDPVGGTKDDGAAGVCYTAYLTAYVAEAAGQVILIGSCEDEKTPFYRADRGIWCSVPDRDLVWSSP